jgi:RimJ/RimL family protein N-acetyltransferase
MTYEIETERLFLRAPRLGDASAIAKGLNNFNVARFLTKVPFPYAEQDAENWISSLSENAPEHRAFVVERDDTGVIGVIGLESELGYWLAESHWGNGYATEAAAATLHWYFDATRAESITSGAHEDNPASLNVQRKLGFEVTGNQTKFCVSRNTDILLVKTFLTRAAFERTGALS